MAEARIQDECSRNLHQKWGIRRGTNMVIVKGSLTMQSKGVLSA